jgi:hypothetical protein
MFVDLTPRPAALIESLRNIGYSLETALADIIDNSISAESSQISVRFEWNKKDSWIAVVDNGIGMSKNHLIEAMRFGSKCPTESRASNDLGRFGLGLKTASISQCRILSVATLQKGKLHGCTLDLDKMNGTWNAKFLGSNTIKEDNLLFTLISSVQSKENTGTVILWRNLDAMLGEALNQNSENAFSETMARSRRHIETVFHRFIGVGKKSSKIRIDFNNTLIKPFDPFGSKSLALHELISEKINVKGHTIEIQPIVMPHASKVSKTEYNKNAGPEGYLENQGFYIYRNKRLIIKSTWFRLIKKEELNKLIRIKVDIPNALDHLWKIDVKKSNATPPQEVLIHLKRIIGKIEGAGKKVFTKRATLISNRNLIPIWIRTVSEGKIKYKINDKHPIIENIISKLDKDSSATLNLYLKAVSEAFPNEVYYADLANDEVTIDKDTNEEDVKEIVLNLVKSMKAIGLEKEQIEEKISGIEIPGYNKRILEKALQ